MDETGRGTPAAGDVPGGLDRLDDGALRALAYGRTTSENDRMRADRAARILASRADRAREAEVARAAAAPEAGGATPGDGAVTTNDLDDDAHDRPSWWTRSRRIGVAVFVGALVVGLGLSAVGERVVAALAPDSLAVFERPASEIEVAAFDRVAEIGVGYGGAAAVVELRHLATVNDIDVFAQLVPADYGTPRSDVGEQVCVVAMAPDANFVSPPCVPRTVFERQGIAGVLSEMDTSGIYPPGDNVRSLSFAWGPLGGAKVSLNAAAGAAR